MADNLPEGFVLDKPELTQLPQGFVLDEPMQPIKEIMAETPEDLELQARQAEIETISEPERMPKIDITHRADIRQKLDAGKYTGRQLEAAQELQRRGLLEPEPWSKVAVSAVKAIPESSKEFGKALITPILEPKETMASLGKLGKGLIEKMMPGVQEDEKAVDQVVNALKDRYGSIEGFKETLSTDPVGVISDIAGVLAPVGGATKIAGKVIPKAAEVGEVISKTAKAIEPLSIAGKTVKQAGKLIPEDFPAELYQSAAKFSTTLPEKSRLKLAQTALDNEILPTKKGLDTIRTKINDFNTEITSLIDKATEAGETIPTKRLFAEFTDLKKQWSSEPITRQKQISRVAKEMNQYFKQLGKKDLTPQEAQKIKQAIYKETESFYSKTKNSPAKVEAKQALAKAAKESLESLFPEIKNLNKKEGELIELKAAIEKAASRISNRDLIGIGMPIKGSLGASIGGPGGAASAVALGLMDTPTVKARLARVANRLKEKGVFLHPESLLARFIESKAPVTTVRALGEIEQTQENK